MAGRSQPRIPFSVVSNPEFLRQGSAVDDFLHPERVVLGSDEPAALELLTEVYGPILDQPSEGGARRKTEPRAHRADHRRDGEVRGKRLSRDEDQLRQRDRQRVRARRRRRHRGGRRHRPGRSDRRPFLDAGIGWGGSCFGKDVAELVAAAGDDGYEARLLRATIEVNRWQRGLASGSAPPTPRPARPADRASGARVQARHGRLADAPALDIASG